ncbi:MAG: hypothetical protein RMK94_15385, partial [Armatimonadota bacterium]|nr:hypothetical protein [Armatimonadota bacterium]
MMKRKKLTSENLMRWIDELVESGRRVVAPVYEAGLTVFRPISSSDEIANDYTKTDLPFKDWLFPMTEVI